MTRIKRNIERDQELEDIRAFMGTISGSRFILRLLNVTGPYRSTFDADALRMAFLEGNRNFGCRIVADLLEACPELYVRLIAEQNIKSQLKENKHETDKDVQDEA